MIRTTFSRSTVLALAFSCIASMACAEPDNNNNGNFTETAKRKAKQGVEWTTQKCETMKQELHEAYANGKVKAQAFADEARTRVNKAFNKGREAENNPSPERVTLQEPKPEEMVDLQVPFEVPADAKPTGAQPIKRGSRVTTETIDLDGDLYEMSSVELSDDAWFEWISSDEAQLYAKGAIAIVTIAGITYILYKNRVPQRIGGYVAKNPVKSVLATASVIALAAYIAHQRGVTVDSIKDMFCMPTHA